MDGPMGLIRPIGPLGNRCRREVDERAQAASLCYRRSPANVLGCFADSQSIAELFESGGILGLCAVQVLRFRDDLEFVVSLETCAAQDSLEWFEVSGV